MSSQMLHEPTDLLFTPGAAFCSLPLRREQQSDKLVENLGQAAPSVGLVDTPIITS